MSAGPPVVGCPNEPLWWVVSLVPPPLVVYSPPEREVGMLMIGTVGGRSVDGSLDAELRMSSGSRAEVV